MYFWNIKKVREELATGEMSERNVFKYFIAHALLFSVVSIPYYYETTNIDIILGIVLVFITIGGLFYVRECNGGYEGKDFFTRLFSISWIVTIKLFVLALLVIFFVGFYDGITNSDLLYEAPVVEAFIIGIFSLVYYWRIGVHIHKTRELDEEEKA